MEGIPTIWNGTKITFTKTNYTNWTENQDRITNNVWITRANIKQENTYRGYDISPSDTEWSYGSLQNYNTLTFTSWAHALTECTTI